MNETKDRGEVETEEMTDGGRVKAVIIQSFKLVWSFKSPSDATDLREMLISCCSRGKCLLVFLTRRHFSGLFFTFCLYMWQIWGSNKTEKKSLISKQPEREKERKREKVKDPRCFFIFLCMLSELRVLMICLYRLIIRFPPPCPPFLHFSYNWPIV